MPSSVVPHKPHSALGTQRRPDLPKGLELLLHARYTELGLYYPLDVLGYLG